VIRAIIIHRRTRMIPL